MADDAHEERFRQHERVMAGLARMLEAQHAMNERQEDYQHGTQGVRCPASGGLTRTSVPPWPASKRCWRG